jgi:hypothetical protein
VDEDTSRRCCNYWESHEKGHQFSSEVEAPSDEVPLAVGEHKSSYNAELYFNRLGEEVFTISTRRGDGDISTKRKLAETAQSIDIALLQSQRTCLSCLSNCPTNTLPCVGAQHAICEKCIRRYTTRSESSWAHLTQCPLGCQLMTSPWKIRVKPDTAGSRVLALDG